MRASANACVRLPFLFSLSVGAVLAALTLAGASLFEPPSRALASLLLQHLAVVVVFAVWTAAARRAVWRAAAWALLVSYVLAIEADTASMAVFSVPADAVAHILAYGDEPARVLAQAHVSFADLGAAVAGVLGQVAVLAILYRRLPRMAYERAAFSRMLAVATGVVACLVAEQAAARGSDDYLRRHGVLPGYWRLFAASADEYTFAMPLPESESRLDQAVARVRGARNPKNVVFVLLESVRYDAIDPAFAPNLHALRERSLSFTNAYAESTYTARVWNVLLLNRPAYMVFRDLEAFESGAGETAGGFPARVLEKAGYDIHVSMPTEFDWFGFQRRFMGSAGLVDRFFSSYPGHNHARHVADDRATDEAVAWLRDPELREPFFLLMQLDSTHYRYFFHEERAVVHPYAEALSPRQATSQESLDLLHSRYKNAVHHVDANVGRVLEALRESGRADDTAVVVISDHGEGFDLGAVAHMQVNHATKHVPWILHLPGVTPAAVTGLTSHADVFPTLFAYLGIEGLDEDVLLGRPAWSPPSDRRSVLTLQGAMKQAALTFPLFTIVFDIGWPSEESLTFSPVSIVGADGKPVHRWRDLLGTLPWKAELQGNLRWARAAEPRGSRAQALGGA